MYAMYSKNHIYTLSLAHCNKDIIVNNEINIQKISIFSFNQYESKNVYNKNRLSENVYKKFDLSSNCCRKLEKITAFKTIEG